MFLKLPTTLLTSLIAMLYPALLSSQPYTPVPVSDTAPEHQFILDETNHLIRTIEKYIKKIADKNGDYDVKTIQIHDLLLNFTNDAMIQVSSIKTGTEVKFKPVPAGDYFRKLRSLFYTQVEITFFEIDRDIQIQKIADGKYEVTGKFEQKFEGFDPYGNKLYGDITIKKLSIEVTNTEFPDGSRGWEFKVKSIMVENTFKDGEMEIQPFQD
jgi:hypothetical protein